MTPRPGAAGEGGEPLNPIIPSDFPDPDVIRVGETYYMASTTMHFMPGAAILRSRDLVDWEIIGHAFDTLDGTDGQRLEAGRSAYGQGMWAPSFRHHQGSYYLCFSANDTKRTYLYRARDPAGPWRKGSISGFYHDPSLLFDGDRVFLAYGNTEIFITELDGDLSGPKPGGLHRMVARDTAARKLGYEGSHLYKVEGRYYLFLIHWLADGSCRRTQACLASDSLEGEFTGRDVFDDDLGFFNQGVAQGGIVDGPDGRWWAVLFQDRGAAGRMPVLLPLRWEAGFPVLGRGEGMRPVPAPESQRAGRLLGAIVSSDDFLPAGPDGRELKTVWEWNHSPRPGLWRVDPERGGLVISTDRLAENPARALNTLTQRSVFPACSASVRVDASALRDGDLAGICAFQGRWAMAAVTREGGRYFAVMIANPGEAVYEMGGAPDLYPGRELARLPLPGPSAELRASLDFRDLRDLAGFQLLSEGQWLPLGPEHRLRYGLDHFTGCRFGLCHYSTRQPGGEARFERFRYSIG